MRPRSSGLLGVFGAIKVRGVGVYGLRAEGLGFVGLGLGFGEPGRSFRNCAGGSLSGVEGDCCDFRALGASVGVWSLSTAV